MAAKRVYKDRGLEVEYVRPSRQAFRLYKPAAMLIGQPDQIPEGRLVEAHAAHMDALETLAKDCITSHKPGELDELTDTHPMLLANVGNLCVQWIAEGSDPKGSPPQPAT